MSTENMKFVLKLQDLFSSPAKKAAESITKVGKAMDKAAGNSTKVNKALGRQEKSSDGVAKATSGMGGGMLKANLAASAITKGLQVAAKVASSVASGVNRLTMAYIDSAAEAEKMQVSLEFMTGSAEAAAGLAKEAAKIGHALAIPDADVLNQFKELLGSGFSAQEVPVVFQAMGDVEAMGGSVSALTNLFNKANALDKVKMSDMERMTRSGSLNIKQIYDSLERQMGIGRSAIEEMLKDGGLDAGFGVNAVLEAIQASSGGPLGTAMLRQSKTFAQQLTRLRSTWDNLIRSMNISRLPGFAMLTRILTSVNQLMDPAAAGGQKLREVIELLDARVAGFFARYEGDGGFARLERDLENVLTVAGKVADAVLLIADAMGRIGSVVAEDLADVSRAAGNWGEKSLPEKVSLIGKVNRFASPAGLITYGTQAVLRAYQDPQELADQTGMPQLASGGIVTRPTIALIGESGPEAVIPLNRSRGTRGSGSGVTVNLTQNIQASEGMDPHALAQLAAERAADVISMRLEGMALQAGAI